MNIVEHPGFRDESYRVTNVPGQYVTVELLRGRGVVTLKRFEVGDPAEYDSYNLSYYGRIVGIGPKTITIQEKGLEGRKHRLSTLSFAIRNFDFDVTVAAARNQEMMLNT